MLTPQEVKSLYAPFPIDVHETREGHSIYGGKKIVWFTYLDRAAIQRRLDRLFPGEWSVSYSDPIIIQKSVYVTCTITIRGLPRSYSGGAEPGFDSESSVNIFKGAYTDAFRRAGSIWGLGLYLQNVGQIATDTYKTPKGDGQRGYDTDWKKKSAVEQEAKNTFASWYSQNFPDMDRDEFVAEMARLGLETTAEITAAINEHDLVGQRRDFMLETLRSYIVGV